jgi:hypothetical protein
VLNHLPVNLKDVKVGAKLVTPASKRNLPLADCRLERGAQRPGASSAALLHSGEKLDMVVQSTLSELGDYTLKVVSNRRGWSGAVEGWFGGKQVGTRLVFMFMVCIDFLIFSDLKIRILNFLSFVVAASLPPLHLLPPPHCNVDDDGRSLWSTSTCPSQKRLPQRLYRAPCRRLRTCPLPPPSVLLHPRCRPPATNPRPRPQALLLLTLMASPFKQRRPTCPLFPRNPWRALFASTTDLR